MTMRRPIGPGGTMGWPSMRRPMQQGRMFSRPNLNMARQFLSGPRPSGQYAGRYPNMQSFAQTPAGKRLLEQVMRNMQQRRQGQGQGRPQVKRETTEYFDSASSSPPSRTGLSNVGRGL